MFYVYILACCRTGRTYVGQTDHLLRRFQAHRAKSTRTTREKIIEPVLVYWEPASCRAAAMSRERYFKAGAGHRRKCELAEAGLREWFSNGG